MKARRRAVALADAEPPARLLGPGRTLPEDPKTSAALCEWLDVRGLVAHGLPPFPAGLLDPIDDLLMGPIIHPGETWTTFVARVVAEHDQSLSPLRTYTP